MCTWLVGVVRRYIDILTIIINFPYSTCITGSSFLAAASLLRILCSFKKMFFRSCIIIFTHPAAYCRAACAQAGLCGCNRILMGVFGIHIIIIDLQLRRYITVVPPKSGSPILRVQFYLHRKSTCSSISEKY